MIATEPMTWRFALFGNECLRGFQGEREWAVDGQRFRQRSRQVENLGQREAAIIGDRGNAPGSPISANLRHLGHVSFFALLAHLWIGNKGPALTAPTDPSPEWTVGVVQSGTCWQIGNSCV
jgi:hypothetical protein